MPDTVSVQLLQEVQFSLWWGLYQFAARTEPKQPLGHALADVENVSPAEAIRWFPKSLFIGAIRDNCELIGIARIDFREAIMLRHKADLSAVYVVAGYRQRGYGKVLLDGAKRIAREHGIERLRLYVDMGNITAIKTYASKGFQITGREPCAKKINGEDIHQFVMECLIPSDYPPDFDPSLHEFAPKDNSDAMIQAVTGAQRSAFSPVGVP